MRSRRRREGMAVNGEINVVSLIDVMMLLMVIFMITAPLMQGGVDVALPKVDAPALESKNAIVVTLNKQLEIIVDGVKMSRADFNRNIKTLAEKKGKEGVYLQADKDVPVGELLELFVSMKNAGIENVGIVTEPPGDNAVQPVPPRKP